MHAQSVTFKNQPLSVWDIYGLDIAHGQGLRGHQAGILAAPVSQLLVRAHLCYSPIVQHHDLLSRLNMHWAC